MGQRSSSSQPMGVSLPPQSTNGQLPSSTVPRRPAAPTIARIFPFMFICVCVSMHVYVYKCGHKCRSEDILRELSLSFHHVVPGISAFTCWASHQVPYTISFFFLHSSPKSREAVSTAPGVIVQLTLVSALVHLPCRME